MVRSIGIDLTDKKRISRLVNIYGERFLHRTCTADEFSLSSVAAERVDFLAGLFAAKEAVMKALGAFFDRGVYLRQIEILCLADGSTQVRLPESVVAKLGRMHVHISIADQEQIVMATAIITEED